MNFILFLHILLKFEINWTRIGQVIRLQNDIYIFPKHPVLFKCINLKKNKKNACLKDSYNLLILLTAQLLLPQLVYYTSKLHRTSIVCVCVCLHAYKLATVVEGDQKAPFLTATTLRCRGGHYSFLWTAPLYPWYVPFNAGC